MLICRSVYGLEEFMARVSSFIAKNKVNFFYLLALFWACHSQSAEGISYTLSDNIRIESKLLGYALQYRVLAPTNGTKAGYLDVIYINDGQDYLQEGNLDSIIRQLTLQEKIKPVMAVFVDSRDPDNLRDNRRHSQFMCNRKYALFFEHELIPTVEASFEIQGATKKRLIMGLSFGALSAGCFGILLPDTFGYVAMQSPASDKHLEILRKIYLQTPVQPTKYFVTIGTRNDNTRAGRELLRDLRKLGYNVTSYEVAQGHNWRNWRSKLEDIFIWFSTDSSAEDL